MVWAIFLSLGFFWFFRTVKIILFYLYLWQLKEYHIGRFLDHFKTEKGWRLFLNSLKIFKVALVAGPFIFPVFFPLVLGVSYLIEFLLFGRSILGGIFKRPVFTKKTILLSLTTTILAALIPAYLYASFKNSLLDFSRELLYADIFTPVLVSAIILLFQPLAVLGRNRLIRKAKQKRAQFKNLLVIGITGSYGKTSTKELLYKILSSKFNVLKTPDHRNSEAGIAQTILNDLTQAHQIFICEMGAYNRGGIKFLCDIAKPKIGVLTGINEQHMATFGSQENIIKTKYELIESLPPDGMAFFNARNKYCVELYERTQGIKKFLYGQQARRPGEENILGAVAVAKELGVNAETGPKIPFLQAKRGVNGLNIIDVSYSANPDGVLAHLEYLKTFPGRKIIVMPCLIELGRASKEVHRRIGAKIAEVCDLAIITTKDRFKEIKEGAGEKAIFLENPKEIFEKIKSTTKPGDVVLLESRVPKQLVNLLFHKLT